MTEAYVFQLFGLGYLAAGLGILVSPKFYARMISQMLDSPPIIYVSGAMAFVAGFLLIRFFSSWSADLPIILTIIGWIALVKGLSAIILPELFIKFSRGLVRSQRAILGTGVVMAALGIAMLYIGFIALA